MLGIRTTTKLIDAVTRAVDANTRSMQASGAYFDAVARHNEDFRARLGPYGGPMVLAASALIPAIAGIALMGVSSQSTRTESTGSLWWKETTTETVPAAERFAMLLIGFLLVLLAAAMCYLARRLFLRQRNRLRLRAILTTVDSIELERLATLMSTTVAFVTQQVHDLVGEGSLVGVSIDYQRMRVVRCGAPN